MPVLQLVSFQGKLQVVARYDIALICWEEKGGVINRDEREKLKIKMKMNWVISLEYVLAVVSYSMWDEVLNVTDL